MKRSTVDSRFIFSKNMTKSRIDYSTVGTRNKKQVGKHRFVPYGESFPYCESISFIKLNFVKHQHSVIASFYNITEFLIASSDGT